MAERCTKREKESKVGSRELGSELRGRKERKKTVE